VNAGTVEPPSLERLKTQLDATLSNLLCLGWTGQHQRCFSPASVILVLCHSFILHGFVGEWLNEYVKGNSETGAV